MRALAEELDTLNRRSIVQRYAERILGKQQPPVESAAGEWHVEFLPDPDGDVAEGAILIDSELRLPSSPELGAGDRTRRITTVHLGQRVTTRQRTSHDALASTVVDRPRPRATDPRRRRRASRVRHRERFGHASVAEASRTRWISRSCRRWTCRASTRGFAATARPGDSF